MKAGIIGYGSMGKMLAERFLQSGLLRGEDLLVTNRTQEKLEPIRGLCRLPENNRALAAESDVVFLCVKPGELPAVLAEIAPALREETLVVSLNANIRFAALEAVTSRKLAKAVPSVTAEVGKSQSLVCYNGLVPEEDRARLCALLACLGDVYELREEEMGMGSELVSCMPGFIAAIFDTVCTAAESHIPFSREQIRRMVLRTLDATGTLMVERELSFETVVRRVATPGGITEEGTKVIYEAFPDIADQIFEVTLAKRRVIAQRAEEKK